MLKTVRTENGTLEGLHGADPRIISFKGIPFAAPPTGENRWRAPQPAGSWDGVRSAFEYAPIAMQATPGTDHESIYTREFHVDSGIAMSEDCLYLNVWTGAHTTDDRLPVLVWFYGGALQHGYTSELEFNGENLARRGIIVVSVSYRVNSFGFLAHPEITAENPDAPANFGHLDQRAGLQWVKRNIAAFGGDPENITIAGQSAGGMSVSAQLTSPLNEGLINRAIIMSGIFVSPYTADGLGAGMPAVTLAQAEQQGVDFFERLGVKTLAEARALDAEYIRQKTTEAHMWFSNCVDGRFCIDTPEKMMLDGRRMPVPLMIGRTHNEFCVDADFAFADETKSPVAALKEFAAQRCNARADEFVNMITAAGTDRTSVDRLSRVNMLEYTANVVCRHSEIAPGTPCYYYEFDASIPGWDEPGAFHSSELWFFFETLGLSWRPFTGVHYDLARQMASYWANFVKSGDPNGLDRNGGELPRWDKYTGSEPECMHFGDAPAQTASGMSPLMRLLVATAN